MSDMAENMLVSTINDNVVVLSSYSCTLHVSTKNADGDKKIYLFLH